MELSALKLYFKIYVAFLMSGLIKKIFILERTPFFSQVLLNLVKFLIQDGRVASKFTDFDSTSTLPYALALTTIQTLT